MNYRLSHLLPLALIAAGCATVNRARDAQVQSMLKLGRAQGVAIAAAIHHDIPIHEYAPLKIKMNLILSAFISATTVKATIMLPIFMVICAIYGASDGHRNNFGRNLVIQNLFQVNIGANAFYTGSGAHLLAISLIAGFLGSCDFGYKEWLVAVGPMSIIILVVGVLMGMYVFRTG